MGNYIVDLCFVVFACKCAWEDCRERHADLFVANYSVLILASAWHISCILSPGGVLRYISDGDVRSPFLGLKFAI